MSFSPFHRLIAISNLSLSRSSLRLVAAVAAVATAMSLARDRRDRRVAVVAVVAVAVAVAVRDGTRAEPDRLGTREAVMEELL